MELVVRLGGREQEDKKGETSEANARKIPSLARRVEL